MLLEVYTNLDIAAFKIETYVKDNKIICIVAPIVALCPTSYGSQQS